MFTKLKDFKSIRKSMHLFNNDDEERLPGKQGKRLKSPASLPNQKSKGKRSPLPAFDSDVEPDNQTEDAAAADFVEHPHKQQPSTPHPQHRDVAHHDNAHHDAVEHDAAHHDAALSTSEASVPLSSSTQASPESSARQSPLRRSFKSLKHAIRRSPPRDSESPSPPQEPDLQFEPSSKNKEFPIHLKRGAAVAPTVGGKDPQAPLATTPPAQNAPVSPAPVTREVTAGQGARQKPGVLQQGDGQKPVTGQDKRHPTGPGFNPSKHRHTWPCEMIPINVPSPENAQTVLHPRKDVFVLKVAKVTANGDRRIKMELELVTPKYGKKLPSRLDTREAQCDPECSCPCACCPKPKKKKC